MSVALEIRATLGILTAATVAVVIVAAPARSQEEGTPVRSGTIIGGYYPFAGVAPGPGPDCMATADCAPWVVAGCPAAMAGMNPALHTSIVDVRAIAGSRRAWTLRVDAAVPVGMLGGVSVQLWDFACTEIYQHGGDFWTAIESAARFKIPKEARWMTVASVDTPPLTWALQ